MSFEDNEVARAARATKDVIKSQGKRVWKQKSVMQEANEPELEPEVAQMTDTPGFGFWRQEIGYN
jgi:hypothetical protein